MLDFLPLTAQNFPEHEKDIMASEEIFPANIRETSEDYLEALQQERALGLLGRYGQNYLGNVVGFAPGGRLRTELRLDEVSPADGQLIYLFNIVTMPEFKGTGYGRRLLEAFLDEARQAGFCRVGGHFRGNGSLKNFKSLGGVELAGFDNWFDTGERYLYCELALA